MECPGRLRWAAMLVAALPQLEAAFVAGPGSAFQAYRLRLAASAAPPAELFGPGDPAVTWEVRDLRLFEDRACKGSPLPVDQALASIGQASGRAALAFDADTASYWSNACIPGEDPASACRSSWEGGAWLGAALAVAAAVGCLALQHGGARTGLLLEAWDAGTSAWRGLQEFGQTPATSAAERVLLQRVRGGACSRAPEPLVANPGETRLPPCTPGTQWRLVALEAILSWSVYELELYRDEECSDLAVGGLPITPDDEPEIARRFVDRSLATAWAAFCSETERSPGGRCSSGRRWVGLAFHQAEDIRCIRIFQAHRVAFGPGSSDKGLFMLEVWQGDQWNHSRAFPGVRGGSWQYLPQRVRPRRSMWRLVNDNTIKEAWVVHELTFMSDEACSQPLAPSAVGGFLSSDGPARLAAEVPKGFDQNSDTAWVSACAPCSPGVAYIGLSFDGPVEVHCVVLQQATDTKYHPNGVSLEAWDEDSGGAFGWRHVRRFRRLQPGLQVLGSNWERAGTRFVILNAAFAPGGWRIAELRLFRDTSCSQRVFGLGIGSDSDPADVGRAFDGRLDTFWHADCCADHRGFEECTGCKPLQAWLGIVLLEGESVQCLQMVQKGGLTGPNGGEQPKGPLLFASERVALQAWNGIRFERVFEWEHVPGTDWVELSVGAQRSAMGSSLGCKDSAGWSRCNATNWTCARYGLEGHCNATHLEDVDCGGLTMRVACRASCCLCEENTAAHCLSEEAVDNSLPAWVVPLAITGSAVLLGLLLGVTGWRRRSCHRVRHCRGCCARLDRCTGRLPEENEMAGSGQMRSEISFTRRGSELSTTNPTVSARGESLSGRIPESPVSAKHSSQSQVMGSRSLASSKQPSSLTSSLPSPTSSPQGLARVGRSPSQGVHSPLSSVRSPSVPTNSSPTQSPRSPARGPDRRRRGLG